MPGRRLCDSDKGVLGTLPQRVKGRKPLFDRIRGASGLLGRISDTHFICKEILYDKIGFFEMDDV